MTEKRYYDDSYTRSFAARVVETHVIRGTPAAVLDQTFFYPTSGGQPHDTGILGGRQVRDVVIEPGGVVLHHLDAPLPEGPVEGAIDWDRRLDHMQQHTGQHILSQAFLRQAGAATIGFHLGADSVSIDLDAAALSDAQVADAASVANAIVTGNVPVRAWFPEPAELASLPLRKTPEVEGRFRVVAIGDFDYSACGGTHVAAAGEVGLISVLKSERLKRGTRIEFLTGGRARRDYAAKHALVRELSHSLTCSPEELPDSVARISAALVESRRQLARYLERELDQEAGQRLDLAMRVGHLRVVSGAWAGRPVDEVKGLALRMTALPGVIALLGVAGGKTQLVFARSDEVTVPLKPLFDRTMATLGGGKGGGTRIMQGAAGESTREKLEAVLTAVASEVRDPDA